MLLDGFVILTQEQVNMLALAAEPVDYGLSPLTGYPVLVAPEWPEKLVHGKYVCFAMEGTLYAFDPEEVKTRLDRVVQESSWFGFASQAAQNWSSVDLFQQSSRSWFGDITA